MTGKVTPRRLPSPRTMLGWDGTDFFAIRVDSDHHLQIDALEVALPTGAATEEKQDAEIATLGVIAVLWNCLRSVHTDRFMVKGEDQLFSFGDTLEAEYHGHPNVDNGYIESAEVPAGVVWVIRSIVAHDYSRASSAHVHVRMIGDDIKPFGAITQALEAGENSNWVGMQILREGETARTYFTGSVVADTCDVWLNGYTMTKET